MLRSPAHQKLQQNQFLPGVVEDVVYHITGEHVFVDISLQDKEHIAESPCQPASVSVYKHMQQLESYAEWKMQS